MQSNTKLELPFHVGSNKGREKDPQLEFIVLQNSDKLELFLLIPVFKENAFFGGDIELIYKALRDGTITRAVIDCGPVQQESRSS